ncbi:MAG: hypothetical protein HRT58_22710 [Crocinitomicaceae bacterium]|nr:hypothetical protein [Crocinitomicaceae bacterium]
MSWKTGDIIQDQYGNKYTLTIDIENQYITGKVNANNNGQGFKSDILGSYVQGSANGEWIYELSTVKTGGNGIIGYKIKGVGNSAAWYYISGYGAQAFTWISGDGIAEKQESVLSELKKGEIRGAIQG